MGVMVIRREFIPVSPLPFYCSALPSAVQYVANFQDSIKPSLLFGYTKAVQWSRS